MAANRWYFTREQIRNSPSVRDGIDYAKELGYRQQCANFIQDIGQRLAVNQLCINTSIVYMHRFYMFHSFKYFHRNVMAPCFLFLGAKVEEQPRKIEHVLKVAYRCLHKDSEAQMDVQSDEYMQMAQDLIDNESILLQTLGFELSVEHPHTYVVKCAQMVKAAKDLAQTSYFLATNSLHLTTFCIEQKPTVVACVCIYVACKWTSYEIPESHDKKHWWEYMDNNITFALIEEMTSHFIKILDSCPTRLKKKISTGPVIYKGGTLQPKREEEGTHTSSDKQKGASASKHSNKLLEKKSGNSESMSSNLTSSDKHTVKNEKNTDISKSKSRNEHSMSSHGVHEQRSKHTDSSRHSDIEKRHAEGHKHRSEHKHRHSEHLKQQSEQGKNQAERHKPDNSHPDKHQMSKKHESKDNMKLAESKGLSPLNRHTENSKATSSDELSQAEKLILSLPPLQHKHSLPQAERIPSESPAKKKKVELIASPEKKQKLEFDASKPTSSSSMLQVPGANQHKRHKLSHSKDMASKDKHKQKIMSDKHALLHKHKQHSSHPSSHVKKHHSKSVMKSVPSKADSEDKSVDEASDKESQPSNNAKHSSMEYTSVSTPKKTSTSIQSSIPSKSTKTPQRSMITTQEQTFRIEKESLPPPPPPPSVDITPVLGSPPIPSSGIPDLYSKQTTPSKNENFEQSTSVQFSHGLQSQQPVMFQMQSQALLHPTQTTSISSLVQPQQVQASYGILGIQPETVVQPQAFQQQAQFLNTSGASGTTYGHSQLFFQEHENQNATLQTFGIHELPRPPPGMILTQVNGLPPPPPINFPFPPPPT